jgi:hypothetical protein
VRRQDAARHEGREFGKHSWIGQGLILFNTKNTKAAQRAPAERALRANFVILVLRIVSARVQEDTENSTTRDRNSPSPGEGGEVMRKFIPVEEVAKEWMRDPEFVAAYDALEDEFAVASALIKARGEADMTQEQVAQAMGTT